MRPGLDGIGIFKKAKEKHEAMPSKYNSTHVRQIDRKRIRERSCGRERQRRVIIRETERGRERKRERERETRSQSHREWE